MTDWTDVNDELPPTDTDVLVWVYTGKCAVAYLAPSLDGPMWMTRHESQYDDLGEVTHWQALPEGPNSIYAG